MFSEIFCGTLNGYSFKIIQVGVFWGYPPPNNSEINDLFIFMKGPLINREISLVSGPGIPPQKHHTTTKTPPQKHQSTTYSVLQSTKTPPHKQVYCFFFQVGIFPSLFGKDEDIRTLVTGTASVSELDLGCPAWRMGSSQLGYVVNNYG